MIWNNKVDKEWSEHEAVMIEIRFLFFYSNSCTDFECRFEQLKKKERKWRSLGKRRPKGFTQPTQQTDSIFGGHVFNDAS